MVGVCFWVCFDIALTLFVKTLFVKTLFVTSSVNSFVNSNLFSLYFSLF
jgi:hypothetical protein